VTTGDGASGTVPGLGLNGTTVAPGSMSGGTVSAILDAAPESTSVAVSPPAPVLPPVSRTVPVALSPPVSLAPPLDAPPVAPAVRSRRRWPWVALVVLVLAVTAMAVQLGRPFPALSMQRARPATTPVSGAIPAMPWPAKGEAAVAVPELGVTVESGPEAAVPIASLTKIMTAYLTLRDHPLGPSAQGPMLTMTAADEAEAAAEDAAGATNVPVQPGENLTERQLLNGLLVHSANNLADVLARWDAGSVPAFVAKMNAAAAALGMTHTHYADASGLDPGTEGTAADELRVTEAAMAEPTFAAVVDQPSVTLPIIGQLSNYVSSVGTDGIVGVKSGFTQAAMGCLVLAGERTVDGQRVLVLAAVTGQPGDDPLSAANQADERLIDAVAAGLRPVPVTPAALQVGTVTLPWSKVKVPVVATAATSLLAWPGQQPRVVIATTSVHPGLLAGAAVGTLTASIGNERVTVPLHLADNLLGPTVDWRLTRS
jgi:serine-type D-Ala-D-Ala carboxypeptidase (penicillin-binding protein 5/6)